MHRARPVAGADEANRDRLSRPCVEGAFIREPRVHGFSAQDVVHDEAGQADEGSAFTQSGQADVEIACGSGQRVGVQPFAQAGEQRWRGQVAAGHDELGRVQHTDDGRQDLSDAPACLPDQGLRLSVTGRQQVRNVTAVTGENALGGQLPGNRASAGHRRQTSAGAALADCLLAVQPNVADVTGATVAAGIDVTQITMPAPMPVETLTRQSGRPWDCSAVCSPAAMAFASFSTRTGASITIRMCSLTGKSSSPA